MKLTEVILEQITDPDMYIFIEEGQRGGISLASHRYAKANNPYMKEHDKQKPKIISTVT